MIRALLNHKILNIFKNKLETNFSVLEYFRSLRGNKKEQLKHVESLYYYMYYTQMYHWTNHKLSWKSVLEAKLKITHEIIYRVRQQQSYIRVSISTSISPVCVGQKSYLNQLNLKRNTHTFILTHLLKTSLLCQMNLLNSLDINVIFIIIT